MRDKGDDIRSVMHVVYCADSGKEHNWFLVCSVFSLLKETQGPVHIHLLYRRSDIPRPGELDVVRVLCSLSGAGFSMHEVTDMLADMLGENGDRKWLHVTSIAFSKLLIPEIFAKDRYPRILYMDTDTVFNRDLSELWNEDLGGRPLGMTACASFPARNTEESGVRDKYTHMFRQRSGYGEGRAGVADTSKVCSTGFILFDLTSTDPMLHMHNYVSDVIERFVDGNTIEKYFHDMALVNGIFAPDPFSEHIKELGPRYMVSMAYPTWYDRTSRGIITCEDKPGAFVTTDIRCINELYGTRYRSMEDFEVNDAVIHHYFGPWKPQMFSIGNGRHNRLRDLYYRAKEVARKGWHHD